MAGNKKSSAPHDELWAGIEFKVLTAEFFLRKMSDSIQPPERTSWNVALEASGAILDTGWQRAFYAYFDAFLGSARSIPEVIQACFGEDLGHPDMRVWFRGLPAAEQARRRLFKSKFRCRTFQKHPLSHARNISVHRTGVPPARVKIGGLYGVTYTGTALKPVPPSETRHILDPNLAFLAKPHPILPRWDDFKIGKRSLFHACGDYLDAARRVLAHARRVSQRVHAAKELSVPPM